jgi:hypothetical protein
MTDRLPLILGADGLPQNLQVGDAIAGQQQVFETATPPAITYPAINFTPVAGFTGLVLQQVNS